MSVLIKGIKMPKECRKCPAMDYAMLGETFCNFTNETLAENFQPITFEGRSESCPLVELPERHGRLIDEDEIIIPSLTSWADQAMVADAIQDAPTIIEAEGAKE